MPSFSFFLSLVFDHSKNCSCHSQCLLLLFAKLGSSEKLSPVASRAFLVTFSWPSSVIIAQFRKGLTKNYRTAPKTILVQLVLAAASSSSFCPFKRSILGTIFASRSPSLLAKVQLINCITSAIQAYYLSLQPSHNCLYKYTFFALCVIISFICSLSILTPLTSCTTCLLSTPTAHHHDLLTT